MDLLEIGSALREARERKGWTFNDVEARIKVAQPMLAALESGDKNCFPHPVYARGFIRSYAALLDLDVAELCADFSREYPVQTDTDHLEEEIPHITVKVHRASHVSWVYLVLVAALLAGGGAALWFGYDMFARGKFQGTDPAVLTGNASNASDNLHHAEPPQADVRPDESAALTQTMEVRANEESGALTSDAAPDAVDRAPAANASGAESASESANQTNASDAAAEHVPQAAMAVVPSQDALSQTQAQPLSPPAQPALQDGNNIQNDAGVRPGARTDAERTLAITAHAATWLQARPDGKTVDYFLRKGESATVVFRQSLSIKFGNAGGADDPGWPALSL